MTKTKIEDLIRQAFRRGFEISNEEFNGEYISDDINEDSSLDILENQVVKELLENN